jgi:hypothetical protein
MTIEQFLACNCVGLELSHARPGTRRFEDGRVILALSAALQSMPLEGMSFGRNSGCNPLPSRHVPYAVTTARGKSGGHGAAGVKALEWVGKESARRKPGAAIAR